jgi:hypothetical protein
MPSAVQRYAPDLAADETVRAWGPALFRHPELAAVRGPRYRQSGVYLVTDKAVRFFTSNYGISIPLDRITHVNYRTEGVKRGRVSIYLPGGATTPYEIFEGRRYMRRLLDALPAGLLRDDEP